MSDPASALGRRIANRVLEDEAWARDKLRAHAGRSFSASCGPMSSAYVVREDGTLDHASASARASAGGGARADVELYVSPLDVPALLAEPARWDALVTSHGDPALVATLKELAATLPWFVERAFAKAFGPILGQRLADSGRALLGFPEYASGRAAATMKSFVRDEAGFVAHGDEARTFAGDTAALAARVDALAEKVEHLTAALGTRAQN